MRILVSGGGTAGHITPILAMLDALKSLTPDLEVLYVGQKGGMEDKIARGAGFEFAAITAGKFRRYHDAKLVRKLTDVSTMTLNTRDLFRVVRGLSQSLRILKRFDPDVVFIKGGYVGLPVGIAAWLLKIPYVIHESDIHPGLTNRILSKRAKAVAVGFPVDRYTELPKSKLVHTGNPVRQELLRAHRLEGLAHFKLSDRLPVVLVVGGSLGAQRLNEVVVEALPELTQRYQILHVTGERDIEHVRFLVKRLALSDPDRYQPFSFLTTNLGQALAVADLVVSRAGANSLAELAALSKAVIVVPAPQLADQLPNATFLARQGAVKVIQQDRLTPQGLTNQIDQILSSPDEQRYLSQSIQQFAVPDAHVKLAKLILQHVPPPPEPSPEEQ